MRLTKCKHWITIAAILLSYIPTIGQQANDSLLHYLEIAADNNPTLRQKSAEYQAALKKVTQAGALSDPQFSTGVLPEPMELVGGKLVAELQVMQMFPWFGALRAARDEMSLMASARYESYLDASLQLFYDIRRTWYEMYGLKQAISVYEKNLELLRSIEQLSLSSYRYPPFQGSSMITGDQPVSPGLPQKIPSGSQGMEPMDSDTRSGTSPMSEGQMMPSSSFYGSSLAELYQIQIDLEDLKNSISLSEDRMITLTARFNGYLDRPAATPVVLPDTLSPAMPDINEFSPEDNLVADNPMLNMMLYEQQSFDSREKMAERMGFPMMGLGLSYSVISRNEMSESHMNGKDMVMPMVSFSLPVFRGKYKAMREEAALLKAATTYNYEATANNLISEYSHAVQDYRDARRRAGLYVSQLTLAASLGNLSIRNYQVGKEALSEVLRAQKQVLDYELKQLDAVVALHTAAAWLKRLEGVSPFQHNNNN